MRLTIFISILSSFLISGVHAQSPTDGRIEGNAYVNSYFHFAYAWPNLLQPYDTNSLHLDRSKPNDYEFLLFSARQGGQPHGLIMIAEKLNVRTAHSNGIRDAQDFLDRVAMFRPEQHAIAQPRKHFRNADGFVFDELDYSENGVPSSAMVTQIGQFLIAFKCDAGSAVDLAEMTRSVAAMHRRK